LTGLEKIYSNRGLDFFTIFNWQGMFLVKNVDNSEYK